MPVRDRPDVLGDNSPHSTIMYMVTKAGVICSGNGSDKLHARPDHSL